MSAQAVGLVRVFSPDTEMELAAIVEMLEARAVPCFVSHMASPIPSGRVSKPRTILVPAPQLAEAVKLIGDLRGSRAAHREGARGRWRLLSALGGFFSPAGATATTRAVLTPFLTRRRR